LFDDRQRLYLPQPDIRKIVGVTATRTQRSHALLWFTLGFFARIMWNSLHETSKVFRAREQGTPTGPFKVFVF
jgi:hypothetical protein